MVPGSLISLSLISLILRVLATPVTIEHTPLLNSKNTSLPWSNIAIQNPNGNDISDKVPIFHNPPSPSDSLKRAVTRSRPITFCPRGTIFQTFWYSRCNRVLSPRSYTGYCKVNPGIGPDRNGFNIFAGRCNPDELCVDSFYHNGLQSTAFCIALADFIPYIQIEHDKDEATILATELAKLGFFSPDDVDSQHSVEAVVTSADTQQSLSTSLLKIQAQKSTIVHDASLWQTLADGTNQCSGCGSVGLSIVPNGTQRILLDVSLTAGITAGKIWFTTWKS